MSFHAYGKRGLTDLSQPDKWNILIIFAGGNGANATQSHNAFHIHSMQGQRDPSVEESARVKEG